MRDTMPAYPLGAKMSDEPGKITAKYYVDTIPPSARHIEHPFKIDMGYKLPMENVVIDNANAIADNATEGNKRVIYAFVSSPVVSQS